MKLAKDFGVRALLATIAVGSGAFAGVWLVLNGAAQLGMSYLSNVASFAMGFYFGQRTNVPSANNANGEPK